MYEIMSRINRIICFIKNTTVKQRVITISLTVTAVIISFVLILVIKEITSYSEIGMIAEEVNEYDEYGISKPRISQHEYNLENITTENGYKYYYENGQRKSTAGIDVSYAQKNIDWTKVKAAGIDFAMIRLGYRGYQTGLLNLDEFYHKNIQEASAAGVETGVYFFSQAVTEKEAEEEAEFVIKNIQNFNITYPVVFDWEVITRGPARTDNLDGKMLTRCCIAFCKKIEEAGYTPMVYASLNLLRKQYDKYELKELTGYDLWLAEYKEYPEFPYEFKIWQYTDKGIIDGIEHPTDIDMYFNVN